MKLLVTGYPPFDAFPVNSTYQLIESMTQDPPPGLEGLDGAVAFAIVEFDNTDSAAQKRTMLDSYGALIDRHRPDLCLFCGQAANRTMPELEAIAVNAFKGEVIEPGGPAAYWATLPDQEGLIRSLNDSGIPARVSYHAGTHLCNHILYTAIHEAAVDGRQMKAGFLHLPMTAKQVIECGENRPFVPLSMTRETLMVAIRHLLAGGVVGA